MSKKYLHLHIETGYVNCNYHEVIELSEDDLKLSPEKLDEMCREELKDFVSNEIDDTYEIKDTDEWDD